MRKALCFPVFILLSVFEFAPGARAQVNPPPDVELEIGGSGATREELSEVLDLFGDFRRSFERIFHPAVEILSPLPLRLGLGVKPHPEAIFEDLEDEEDAVGIRGTEEPKATSFFVRGISGGVQVYSLDGDFSGLTEKNMADVTPKTNATTPKDRGEVWGAKIARGEEEISSWLADSGVTLVLLGVVGSAFLAVVFLVVRKVLRAIKGGVGEVRKVGRVWRES